MNNDIGLGFAHATSDQQKRTAVLIVDRALARIRQLLVDGVEAFLARELSPTSLFAFELALVAAVRELGRTLLEETLNLLEPDEPATLPLNLRHQGTGYRRRKEKTCTRHLATCFGNIVLCRRGYRGWERPEGSIFPLEMLLGICHGTTPALRDWIGCRMADTGASQSAVIDWLNNTLSVTMGVKRLRKVTNHVSEALGELREEHQVQAVLNLLATAQKSSGCRKPVLSAGRDGITLRQYANFVFEVATAATLTVYDRAGKRLGTIYLAWPPELGQATMDKMLTDLLKEVLRQWEGPLPRLAYVSDSGSNETAYYEKTLKRVVHPRTGKRLSWQRVADYYHVSERIWKIAGILFGKDSVKANAWARRMLKALKKKSGPSRVLHSAACHFRRRKRLSKEKQEAYEKATNYIRSRTKFMRYDEYAWLHIPLGSGVTEAACKTIFTQRLKLSGMRWSFEGAKSILTLRTILLSGTWEATYGHYLENLYPGDLRPYDRERPQETRNAA